MPKEFLNFEEIRQAANMAILRDRLGIVKKNCPFCKNKTAFYTYEDSKRFHCFACKKDGGCFDLVMLLKQGMDLRVAAAWIRDVFAVPVEKPKQTYMEQIDEWLDQVCRREDGEDELAWSHRIRNAIKGKLIESYKAGERGNKVA